MNCYSGRHWRSSRTASEVNSKLYTQTLNLLGSVCNWREEYQQADEHLQRTPYTYQQLVGEEGVARARSNCAVEVFSTNEELMIARQSDLLFPKGRSRT